MCHTTGYADPLITSGGGFSTKTDAYAVGVTLLVCLTGRPAVRGNDGIFDAMGVAVFNGAISTFLAVIVLSSSKSYVFMTFFRQLFLCIVFGLGHGLVLLPVLMSLFPPKPFDAPAHLQ